MVASKYQTAIYDWVQNGTGNCIVGAVAGSGKTTSAISSMPFMVGNVLSLAFNKRIAMSLTAKLGNMGLPNTRAATFHSEGMKNLIKSKGRVNVANSKVYFITERYCQTPQLSAAIPFITKLVGFAKEYAFGVKGQRAIDDNDAWMEIIQTQDISLDANVA